MDLTRSCLLRGPDFLPGWSSSTHAYTTGLAGSYVYFASSEGIACDSAPDGESLIRPNVVSSVPWKRWCCPGVLELISPQNTAAVAYL
jgi:hypothetical protein